MENVVVGAFGSFGIFYDNWVPILYGHLVIFGIYFNRFGTLNQKKSGKPDWQWPPTLGGQLNHSGLDQRTIRLWKTPNHCPLTSARCFAVNTEYRFPVRQRIVRQYKARQDKVRQCKPRQNKVRQYIARQK
jgi:hypothetical protein